MLTSAQLHIAHRSAVAWNLLLLRQACVREVWLDCNRWLMEMEPGAGNAGDWFNESDEPTIEGQPFSPDVDHHKRFLTTCKIDKLITTHFDRFEHPEVLAVLACVEVVVREPEDEHNREDPEDLGLGQAVAHLRPALLAFAAPGKLAAQDFRKEA